MIMALLLLGLPLSAIADSEPAAGQASSTFLAMKSSPNASNIGSDGGSDSDSLDSYNDSRSVIMRRVLGAPSITTVNTHGVACTGDDCYSKAACPIGTSLLDCESEPADGGDGIQVESGRCIARGSATPSNRRRRRRRHYFQAIASCSSAPTSVVASSSIFLDNQEVTAACRHGTALNCYCHSAWTSSVCGGKTAFAPSGSTCKKTIGASPGRRRMRDGGAGAIVYALCLDPVTTTQAPTPAPTPAPRPPALVCSSVPPTWQQCMTDQRCWSFPAGDPAQAGCRSYCDSRCR